MGVSIIVVIAVLNTLQRYMEYQMKKQEGNDLAKRNFHRAEKINNRSQYLYVFGNLLSQGFQ